VSDYLYIYCIGGTPLLYMGCCIIGCCIMGCCIIGCCIIGCCIIGCCIIMGWVVVRRGEERRVVVVCCCGIMGCIIGCGIMPKEGGGAEYPLYMGCIEG